MESARAGTTRRRVLVRLGGLLGATTAAGLAPAAADAHRRKGGCHDDARSLVLLGANWHAMRPAEPGAFPVPGSAPIVSGDLTDAEGAEAGTFRSQPLGDSATLHRFELADGMILGLGPADGDEGDWAVAGGTGAYSGLAGAYHATQRSFESGGDGTAAFTFQLSSQTRQERP